MSQHSSTMRENRLFGEKEVRESEAKREEYRTRLASTPLCNRTVSFVLLERSLQSCPSVNVVKLVECQS